MPYSKVEDLPKSVKDNYSEKCQRAFMHAFNSDYDKNKSESMAMAVGHTAAKNCEKANK